MHHRYIGLLMSRFAKTLEGAIWSERSEGVSKVGIYKVELVLPCEE